MLRCAAMAKARTQGRVCLIGLDSVPPTLLFHKFWPHLPNLRRLATQGGAGVLRSCDPPITVPAWAAMMTGHDPGTLGLYGFHDRVDHTYDNRRLASSASYTQPPLWDLLSAAGHRCCVLGLPHTYPPRPLLGRMVTGMLTPPDIGVAAYPADALPQARALLGVHTLDVEDFRHTPLSTLVAQVEAASRGLFRLAAHWGAQDDWSFLALVDMGPDRLQHALWQHAFADHPKHVPGHPLQDALLRYYVLLDDLLGDILKTVNANDMVLVVSDHGACAMHQAVALNTWLIAHGYLTLRQTPTQPQALQARDVDWARTRAWADGGYVGRIYVNQLGREPCGVVPQAETDALLTRIASELAASLPTPPMPHRFLRPHAIYARLTGCAPDLLVYLANLRWRAIASVGWDTPLVGHNDRGPDGANHDTDGVIVMGGPASSGVSTRHSIYDIAPTVLAHLQVPIPATMLGTPITARQQETR